MSLSQRRLSLGWLAAALAALSTTLSAAADVRVEDLTGSAVASVGPYYQDVSEAIAAFSSGDAARALAHLRLAKQSTPVLAPPEVMLAQLQFAAGQPQAAIAMLEQVIRSDPGDPEAYVFLLERAVGEGRLTEAGLLWPQTAEKLTAFDQNPLRKKNLQLRAYTAGAAVDEALGDLAAARSKLEQLVKLDPESAVTHQRLGRVLMALGDADSQKRALAEFTEAAKLDTNALAPDLMMAMLTKDAALAQRLDRSRDQSRSR